MRTVSRLLWAQTQLAPEPPNGRMRRHPLLTIYIASLALTLGGAVLLTIRP